MPTLEQQRAALAFTHVSEIERKPDEDRKKYAAIVHKLPSLLRTAGLCQTLEFVHSRKGAYQVPLSHLAAQLTRSHPPLKGGVTELLAVSRQADLPLYQRLTHEAIACADWYRRFVQSVLKIDPADVEEHE